MNLAARILRLAGWTLNVSVPDYPRCIICVAPHTSNWDFVIGKLAYAAIGRKAGFLMKKSWFFWPMGCLFRAIGGIPVAPKGSGGDLTATLIERFKNSSRLTLAITPEGTRSRNPQWRTGFLRIAYGAGIPIVLAAIDFSTKSIFLDRTFTPTGNLETDMQAIKQYYRPFKGKYPEKFAL
ncbi:MAG: 1-acyl-sn-glycerol-3-phosphate acyltransferase [Muribaculaceae bacterium]|nr:1-acyl-sn-glycerol-3-phosphate acyltransferase [Muribaculaceae bacterium]MDE5930432.1 1-acyl-sn-glycerol-3-phosphate acyltransferase [Muribaculaceae bacterium]